MNQAGVSTRNGAFCVGIIDNTFDSGLQFYVNSSSGKSYINGWTAYDIIIGNGGCRVQFGTDSTSDPSAQVMINSTTSGFLPPRMTDAQVRAIASPAVGLMAYNTDLDCPVFYSSAGWRKVSHSAM